MRTLQSYITDAQRLLHDATGRFWDQTELTDYANKARRKVAAESGCTRQVVSNWPLAQGITKIDYTTIIVSRRVIGLLDVYLWWNTNLRIPLRYLPYSQFSRSALVAYNYQGPPEIWSQVGTNTAYVARIPDKAYTLDFDASVEPLDLVNLTDSDLEIPSPFDEAVKFYMGYLAKLKDQSRPEAEAFLGDYMRTMNTLGSSTMIRKLVGS